jgi:hypothetical protein
VPYREKCANCADHEESNRDAKVLSGASGRSLAVPHPLLAQVLHCVSIRHVTRWQSSGNRGKTGAMLANGGKVPWSAIECHQRPWHTSCNCNRRAIGHERPIPRLAHNLLAANIVPTRGGVISRPHFVPQPPPTPTPLARHMVREVAGRFWKW